MARANVTGAIAQRLSFRPYQGIQAPGRHQATAAIRSGEIWANTISNVTEAIVSAPQKIQQYKMAELQLEKAQYENDLLKQNKADSNIANQQAYNVLKQSGSPNIPDTFADFTKATNIANKALAQGITDVPDAAEFINVDGVQEEVNWDIPLLTSTQKSSMVNDMGLWKNNSIKDITQFKNQVNKNGGIDRFQNPNEYIMFNALEQGSPPSPEIVGTKLHTKFTAMVPKLDENNRTVLNDDGTPVLESQSVSVPAASWEGKGLQSSAFTPLEPPVTIANTIFKNKNEHPELYKTFNYQETEWTPSQLSNLANVFQKELDKPGGIESFQDAMRVITKQNDLNLVDVNGDEKVNAVDAVQILTPHLNQGRKTQSQINKEKGFNAAQTIIERDKYLPKKEEKITKITDTEKNRNTIESEADDVVEAIKKNNAEYFQGAKFGQGKDSKVTIDGDIVSFDKRIKVPERLDNRQIREIFGKDDDGEWVISEEKLQEIKRDGYYTDPGTSFDTSTRDGFTNLLRRKFTNQYTNKTSSEINTLVDEVVDKRFTAQESAVSIQTEYNTGTLTLPRFAELASKIVPGISIEKGEISKEDLNKLPVSLKKYYYKLQVKGGNSTSSINFDDNNPLDQEIQSLLNA